MERSGAVADKVKYKRLVASLQRREERQQFDDGTRSTGRLRNEHLERFKFWLGMPNNYYY